MKSTCNRPTESEFNTTKKNVKLLVRMGMRDKVIADSLNIPIYSVKYVKRQLNITANKEDVKCKIAGKIGLMRKLGHSYATISKKIKYCIPTVIKYAKLDMLDSGPLAINIHSAVRTVCGKILCEDYYTIRMTNGIISIWDYKDFNTVHTYEIDPDQLVKNNTVENAYTLSGMGTE